MAGALRSGLGPACVVGADIPGITRARIAEALTILGDHDAVFGPAPDGGYWLVGLKHPQRAPNGLFQNVRWSSDHALADSMATLPGYRIGRAATLRDVDTLDDLNALSV